MFNQFLQNGLDPLAGELLDHMHPLFTPPVLGSLTSQIDQATQYAAHALALASQQEVARRQVFNALRQLLVYAESQDCRLKRVEFVLRRVAACPTPDLATADESVIKLFEALQGFTTAPLRESRFDYADTVATICGTLLASQPPPSLVVPAFGSSATVPLRSCRRFQSSSAPPSLHRPCLRLPSLYRSFPTFNRSVTLCSVLSISMPSPPIASGKLLIPRRCIYSKSSSCRCSCRTRTASNSVVDITFKASTSQKAFFVDHFYDEDLNLHSSNVRCLMETMMNDIT